MNATRPWHRYGLRYTAVLLTVLLGSMVSTGRAQSTFCDPALPAAKEDPYGYRERGDRCEGRYIREVGATALIIGGFVQSFASIEHAGGRPLLLAWPPPPNAADVRLRAQGIKRRLYYRMDTRQPAQRGSFAWPTDLLAAVVRGRDDIGIMATVRLPVAGTEREVLLPLRAGHEGALQPGTSYHLVIVPGVQLSELFITLSPLDARGLPLPALRSNVPLEYGYYPAERAIDIPITLAELKSSGLYRIDLVARLEGGGAATSELYFFHPDRR